MVDALSVCCVVTATTLHAASVSLPLSVRAPSTLRASLIFAPQLFACPRDKQVCALHIALQVPKETSKLVSGVRVLHDAIPTVVDPIIAAINAISAACLSSIEREADSRSTLLQAVADASPGHSYAGASVPLDRSTFKGLSATAGTDDGAEGTSLERVPAVETPMSRRARGPSHVALPELSDVLYKRLQGLLRVNHSLLNALGVGHAALDGVCSLTGKHGCASKLTGAGGGGCALTLLPPHMTHIDPSGRVEDLGPPGAAKESVLAMTAELVEMGYDCFQTRLGGAGVLIQAHTLPT